MNQRGPPPLPLVQPPPPPPPLELPLPTATPSWFDLANKPKLFWILQGLGWSCISLLAAGILRTQALLLLPTILFRAVLGLTITSWLLQPLLRWGRKHCHLSLALGIPLLLASSLALGAADSKISTAGFAHFLAHPLPPEADQIYLKSSVLLRSFAYALWISLYLSINYFLETSHARLRLARLESETRESELHLLRAQVNPHFLFNALNSIIAEADHPDRVIEITHRLADFLRFSLTQNGTMHPLGEELDALSNYLQVEKIRFEERFEYSLTADAAARRQLVPHALVQPLLENAVKYGMQTSPRPLRVALRAHLLANQLVLEVENSGTWMTPPSGTSTGIGLANLRRRLDLIYGPLAKVEPLQHNHGVLLRVTLPLARPTLPPTP